MGAEKQHKDDDDVRRNSMSGIPYVDETGNGGTIKHNRAGQAINEFLKVDEFSPANIYLIEFVYNITYFQEDCGAKKQDQIQCKSTEQKKVHGSPKRLQQTRM